MPGGDFVSALLDRQVMGFADRGGASGLVGDRWADVSASAARSLVGGERALTSGRQAGLRYIRLVRLDDVPRVAATAAKRGLQNPDLLLFGERDGNVVIQAADAKFSIETARAKQVSPEVVQALLGLGEAIDDLLGGLDVEPEIEPGFFICPDYPLTRAMLNGRHGILKTTVALDDVLLIPIKGGDFFSPIDDAEMIAPLAAVDQLGVDLEESLLADLYYFRLARAAVGCWLDSVRPLLSFNDVVPPDLDAVIHQIQGRAASAISAFSLILEWNGEVEMIRAQRAEIDRATGLPLMTKDLKALIAVGMEGRAGEPPSLNHVRRRLGAWFRGQLRDELGPMIPPAADFDAAVKDAGAAARRLAPRLPAETIRLVREMTAETANETAPVAGSLAQL